MAMAARRERGLLRPRSRPRGESLFDHDVYVIASDGDLEEGVSGEASSLAGHQQLGNLMLLYDDNKISIEDDTTIAFSEDVAKRYEAYGWHVQTVDWTNGGKGYEENVQALFTALPRRPRRRPSGRASSGCARSSAGRRRTLQNTGKAHGSALGADEVAATKKVLGFDPDQTFEVADDVIAHTRQAIERGKAEQAAWQEQFDAWAAKAGDRKALFDRMRTRTLPARLDRRAPDLRRRREGRRDPRRLRRGAHRDRARCCPSCGAAPPTWPAPTTPRRRASRASSRPSTPPRSSPATGTAACCTSASASTPWARSSTASPCTAAPGPYGGTFLVFSDYMRPAVRLAALMKLPVTYVWTHDSIGLGEDGPTHQPIEHLAALRAIPGLDVVRPADANETVGRLAGRSSSTPTARPGSR